MHNEAQLVRVTPLAERVARNGGLKPTTRRATTRARIRPLARAAPGRILEDLRDRAAALGFPARAPRAQRLYPRAQPLYGFTSWMRSNNVTRKLGRAYYASGPSNV